MLLYKQKAKVTIELIRREGRICKNHVYAKTKTKQKGIGRRKKREEI
jgi:hypothetical protein